MSASFETSAPARPTKTRRRTQAERTATAHRKMIRAATKLIAKQGYTKTTLAQVGRESGYSGGLVSHHFGSKEGLLMETVKHLSGRFREDQIGPAVEGLTGLERLETFVDLYFDELRLRPGRLKALYVLMGEAIGPVPDIRPVFAKLNDQMRRGIEVWIQQGLDEGCIRSDVDSGTQALMIVAMFRGVTSQAFTDKKAVDLEAARAALKQSIQQLSSSISVEPAQG